MVVVVFKTGGVNGKRSSKYVLLAAYSNTNATHLIIKPVINFKKTKLISSKIWRILYDKVELTKSFRVRNFLEKITAFAGAAAGNMYEKLTDIAWGRIR